MDRLYYTSVTIPAGTLQSAPVSTPWVLEEAHLKYIDIIIPDGPGGTAGFRILWAQQQIIPWANNSYLAPNNEKIHVDTDVDITISGLVIQTYNTDTWPHTFYFRGLISDLKVPQLIDLSALSGQLTVPGSQVNAGDSTGIDTMTGSFSSPDGPDTGEEPDGGMDSFDSAYFDTGQEGDIGSTGEIEGQADLPAQETISALPSSVTLVGTKVTVTASKAPGFGIPVTVKKRVPVHKIGAGR
jgi:hypothetical protein